MHKYLVIIPMINLEISEQPPINGKWKVDRVSFLTKQLLEDCLKNSTGVFSLYKAFTNFPILKTNWDVSSYAKFEVEASSEEEAKRESFRLVLHESFILASTKTFYGRRQSNSGFTILGYPWFNQRNIFLYDTGEKENDTGKKRLPGGLENDGNFLPFMLDEIWHKSITVHGYDNIFSCIRDKNIDDVWRRQIASAAAMHGRSLMSLTRSDAFLYNIYFTTSII